MDLARNLKVESVSRLHPPAPHVVRPDQTVADAVSLMCREKVGCVMVCDGEQLVGILTERDVLRRALAAGKPLTLSVAECMTARPVCVHRKESIGAAVRHMEEGGYRHLPVLDEAGRLIGVLSVKRIVHYLVEHFPQTVYNQNPNPGGLQQDREGA